MKRLIVMRMLFISIVMSVTASLAGCGNNAATNAASDGSITESNVSATTEVLATELETERVENETKIAEETEKETAIETESEVETETETESEDTSLTSTQRNSINMLNYITVLTQQINESKGSRIYLESVQASLLNDIYPNAVDSKTQSQINNLWKTIDGYRMISVKRERLDYIYEQNKAQALRQAIPNPLGLLSTVQSGNLLKTAASVLYMAVDSVSSYQSASTQAELKYLQDNWELEDAETQELSASQLNLLNYMIDMVRANEFPGECALNEEAVKAFVEWSNKENLASKIEWFESHYDTYQDFRTYWLELARSYYDDGQYEKCLESINTYEDVATRIFRKDYDYAEILPMGILAAKEIYEKEKYVEVADKYAKIILDNTGDDDWALRYFAAQIYIDIYANTGTKDYLEMAYDIALDNVNVLKSEQLELNAAYLAGIQKVKVEKDDTKSEKKEKENYNKLLTEKRKVELPPVSEAFYLNCDLLFALVDELDLSEEERKHIDAILHESDTCAFLTPTLDNRFWATGTKNEILADDITIEFDGEEVIIPAACITDRYSIEVSVNNGDPICDWIVKEVERPKNAEYTEYMVTLTSEEGKEYEYSVGDSVRVSITPVEDNQEESLEFSYEVVEKKKLKVFDGITFERIIK